MSDEGPQTVMRGAMIPCLVNRGDFARLGEDETVISAPFRLRFDLLTSRSYFQSRISQADARNTRGLLSKSGLISRHAWHSRLIRAPRRLVRRLDDHVPRIRRPWVHAPVLEELQLMLGEVDQRLPR